MKKTFVLILTVLYIHLGFSQTTASNFNCNDCSATTHDLFTELNANKVIVIAWVMPCANCICGALAAYTEAQNFLGQAYFYLADDFANTNCTTLSSWAKTNGIGATAVFSNAAVSMSAYGTAGVPKVVVLGGSKHTVYYNENDDAITSAGINTAIAAARTVKF